MSWLDILPSSERAKIRARMRSPEEYERLREKVKGPEQLKEEMNRNEHLAELSFALETEPQLKEALKKQIEDDLREQGAEAVLDVPDQTSDRAIAMLKEGFDIRIDAHPNKATDQICIVPEGNVQEKIPVRGSLSEQYVQQFVQSVSDEI